MSTSSSSTLSLPQVQEVGELVESSVTQSEGYVNGEFGRRAVFPNARPRVIEVGSNKNDRERQFANVRADSLEQRRAVGPILIPPGTLGGEQFRPLKRFEGVVLSVLPETFSARISEISVRGLEEDAEFDFAEISPDDRELVKPGAQFYWILGYEQKEFGQRIRCSFIRFRRLPKWTASEIDEALSAARILRSFLDLSLANGEAED